MCVLYENIKSKERLQAHFGANLATGLGKADVWPGYEAIFTLKPKSGFKAMWRTDVTARHAIKDNNRL